MNDFRKSGIAMIAGALGGVVTMAIHPMPVRGGSAELFEHMAVMSGVAHSLALVSMTALLLGACGLAWRLRGPDRIAFCGLVVFALATVAICIAGTVSGWIEPNIMRHMAQDVPEAGAMWRIVISGVFQFNQAFANVYTVAASIAVGLWSWAVLRGERMGRGLGWYGLVLASVLILAMCSGHLRLDVHGMAAVALGQAIWFVGAGMQLMRVEEGAIVAG